MGALDMYYDVSSAIEEIIAILQQSAEEMWLCVIAKQKTRSSPFVTTSDLRKILCDISKTQQNVLFFFFTRSSIIQPSNCREVACSWNRK